MQDQPVKNESLLLSIGGAAEFLGISIDTLRRWEKKTKVKTYRSPGGHRYFKKEDLEKVFGSKYERTQATIRSKKNNFQKESTPTDTNSKQSEFPKDLREDPEWYISSQLNVPKYIKTLTLSKYDRLFQNPTGLSSLQNRSILEPAWNYSSTSGNKKFNFSLNKITIILFGVLLTIGILIFFIWYASPKIVSPIP